MLPQIACAKSSSSRRGRWSLILGSLVLFALPTWFVAAQSQDAKPKPSDVTAAKKGPPEVKSATPAGVTEPLLSRTPHGSPTLTAVAAASSQTGSPQVEFFPELSKKEQGILQQLDMPTTFDFTDESLDGVRETIIQRHRFDILIDKVELEEESIALDATDITLKVNEIPLRSALNLLLGGKNLAYVIEDDVMKIITKTAYATDRLTRTYPVRDLMPDLPADDLPNFQSLMEAIKQGVTPGDWKDAPDSRPATTYPAPVAYVVPGETANAKPPPAPACTITMVPASGSLVIHQTWQGHDEVLKLLRSLRLAKNLSPRK